MQTNPTFPGYPMVAGRLPEPLGDCRKWLAQPLPSGLQVVFGKRRIWSSTGADITGWGCFKGCEEDFDFGDLMLTGVVYAESNVEEGAWAVDAEGVEVIATHHATPRRHMACNIPKLIRGEQLAYIAAMDVMLEEPLEIRVQILSTLFGESNEQGIVAWLAPICFRKWTDVLKMLKLCWHVDFDGVVLKMSGSTYCVGDHDTLRFEDWVAILGEESVHIVGATIIED